MFALKQFMYLWRGGVNQFNPFTPSGTFLPEMVINIRVPYKSQIGMFEKNEEFTNFKWLLCCI